MIGISLANICEDMTILQIDTSRGFGGQQEWVLRLSNALSARGHQVILACRPETLLAWMGAERGLRVLPLPVRNSVDLWAIGTLVRTIRREGVEIIHTHNAATSWAAWFAAHAWPFGSQRPALIRTRHLMKKSRYGFPYRYLSDRVVVVSEHLRSYLVQEVGIPSSKVVVISPGVETDFYQPAFNGEEIRQELAIPAEVPVIGMIAFLRREKGQSVLIEAAPTILSRFPNVYFLLVGSGGDERRLRGLAREKGIERHVIFTGYRTDIPRLLTAIDLFVAPSFSEALGISILEAMSMEKPVIASNVGGIPEVISNEKNGLLIPPGDPGAFAEAILSLLCNSQRAEKLGKSARKTVEERYHLHRAVDDTVSLYQSVREEIRHGRIGSRHSNLDVPPREQIL